MNLQFYQTESVIHKLDPRLKFFTLMLISTEIFFIKDIFTQILILAAIFFCIYLSKIPLKFFLHSIKNISSLIILTSTLNIFFITNGNTVFKLFFVHITDYAIMLTLQMILRMIILVSLCALVIFSTPTIKLTDALVSILMPFEKFLPINEIAMIISIALRFIPVLSNEFNLIKKAQMSRGINFSDKNFINRIKNYLSLLIPIFILSFKRADDLALAMDARCYNPSAKRNSLKKLKFQAVDFVAIIFLFVFHFELWLIYIFN